MLCFRCMFSAFLTSKIFIFFFSHTFCWTSSALSKGNTRVHLSHTSFYLSWPLYIPLYRRTPPFFISFPTQRGPIEHYYYKFDHCCNLDPTKKWQLAEKSVKRCEMKKRLPPDITVVVLFSLIVIFYFFLFLCHSCKSFWWGLLLKTKLKILKVARVVLNHSYFH